MILIFLIANMADDHTQWKEWMSHITEDDFPLEVQGKTDVATFKQVIKGQVSEKELDTLLATELSQLTTIQREEVYDDIHGVVNVAEETTGWIQQQLIEMEQALQAIEPKHAYRQAEQIAPDLVHSLKFRLLFLRADRFHATDAATRMVNYLEEKYKLFGPDKLMQDIQLKDLNAADMECLTSGFLQQLPGRDRAGRAVLISVGRLRRNRPTDALVRFFARVAFFVLSCLFPCWW